MGHVETQGLDDPGAFGLQVTGDGLEGVGGEELPGLLQLADLVIAAADLRFGDRLLVRVLFQHGSPDLLKGVLLEHGNHIIGQRVDHVHRAGADVQHDVVTAQLVLVNHGWFLPENA